ncbi:MAG TPA: P-II family nitrogen regulator [Phycisphaerales bacterium]|nr:P-II family nitrogen regulator [Phycisphaerales bacterium]HEW78996.1 P-II family nitrogen regulator [Phycisphaerales bacterium]
MKMIVAIIQPERLEAVKKELFNAEIHKMTVSRVRGCGQQKGYDEHYRGQIKSVNLLEKIRIEIAVNDEFAEPTVKAIIKGAKTDTIGDGKIFVWNLLDCIRIRTGDKGGSAIG